MGGDIVIDPFDAQKINPNSYNLSLYRELLIYTEPELDMKKPNPVKRIGIPETGLRLEPGRLYLCRTREYTKAANTRTTAAFSRACHTGSSRTGTEAESMTKAPFPVFRERRFRHVLTFGWTAAMARANAAICACVHGVAATRSSSHGLYCSGAR